MSLHDNIACLGLVLGCTWAPKCVSRNAGAEGGGPTGPDGAAASSRPPPPGLLHCAPAPQVGVHRHLVW